MKRFKVQVKAAEKHFVQVRLESEGRSTVRGTSTWPRSLTFAAATLNFRGSKEDWQSMTGEGDAAEPLPDFGRWRRDASRREGAMLRARPVSLRTPPPPQ